MVLASELFIKILVHRCLAMPTHRGEVTHSLILPYFKYTFSSFSPFLVNEIAYLRHAS